MDLQLWSVPDPKFEQDRAIKSEETIVDRTNCTTPNRNALRKPQPSSNCELFSEDSCLRTPSPDCKRAVKYIGPPKIDPRSRHKSHSGAKALWNADQWDHYSCQFQDLCKYESEGPQATAAMDEARKILGSPFRERPSALPSKSAPCSGEIRFPLDIVAYDHHHKRESSSEPSNLIHASNASENLVSVEPRSKERHVNDNHVS